MRMRMRSYCQVIALAMRGLDPVVNLSCDFTVEVQSAMLLSTYTGLAKGVSSARWWVTTDGLTHHLLPRKTGLNLAHFSQDIA